MKKTFYAVLFTLFLTSCEQKDYSEQLDEIRSQIVELKQHSFSDHGILADIMYQVFKVEYKYYGKKLSDPNDYATMQVKLTYSTSSSWDTRVFNFKQSLETDDSKKELGELLDFLKYEVVYNRKKYGLSPPKHDLDVWAQSGSFKSLKASQDKIQLSTIKDYLEKFFIGAGFAVSTHINPKTDWRGVQYNHEKHYYHRPFFREIK
jgi:hypothetical protein